MHWRGASKQANKETNGFPNPRGVCYDLEAVVRREEDSEGSHTSPWLSGCLLQSAGRVCSLWGVVGGFEISS
jgi:hypothetical protein